MELLGTDSLQISVALAVLCTLFLIREWKGITRLLRIDTESIASVEHTFKRIPSTFEIAATNALTVLLLVLSVQFVAKVYAMSFSVNGSTVETKDTRDMVMADLDGDGDIDYIAGNTDTGAPILNNDVYRNNGSFSFTRMGAVGSSTYFSKFAVGDIDNDGDADVVTATAGTSYFVTAYKNLGNYSFLSTYAYGYVSEVAGVNDVALVDVDTDGDLDIVVVTNAPVNKAVHINDGHGNFTAAFSTLRTSSDLLAADFNSDGYIDLALTNGSNVYLYRNSGTGAFVEMGNGTALNAILTIAAADVDADGDIDILASDSSTPVYVNVFSNNGAGTLTGGSPVSVYNYGVNDLATADFDSDGDIDFLDVASDGSAPANGNELWVNGGGGSFTNHWQAAGSDTTSSSLAVGDLDADGVLDYVLGRSGTTANDQLKGSGTANTSPSAPSLASMTGALVSPTPKYPLTAANDNAIGNDVWNNVSNALTDDGSVALDSTSLAGDITNYLKLTNFQLNVPSSATISGIKVEVKKRRGNASYTVNDYAVKLVVGGSVTGDNKADTTTNWPTSFAYSSYGGASDTWGVAGLNPSNVNASTFGVVIAAINNGGAASSMANVDTVRITVYYSLRDIRLSWGSGSDTETTTRLLQYQLRVGTGSNANNIVSGVTASPTWVTRLMPNGQSRSYLLRNLVCGKTYYWNVATVDTGFRSTWGTESSFTIDSQCGFVPSGGSSGSSGTPNTAGGGLSRIVLNQPSKTSTDSSVKNAVLSVSAFLDVNSDGVKQVSEQSGFKGLAFTASGSTTDGTKVRKTILLNDKGTNSFDLPPSDTRGYSVFFDTGSEVLKGFESTTDEILTKITLTSGEKKAVSFGFVRSDLLRYKPCLDFGPPERDPVGSSEAAKLLVRLTDTFGVSLTKGLSLQGDLMTRRDFFTLLQRTQCLALFTDESKLITALKEALAGRLVLPLIDLPLSLRDADSTLMHSLLALGLRTERMTLKGPGADLASPVTRQEAVLAVFDALKIPKHKIVSTGGTLPVDVDASDPIVTPYLTLQSLGILPSSFLPVFGPTKGLNPDEAATLLARAAFRGGKISLLPVTLDQSTKKKLKSAPKVPTFLSELPTFKLSSCLEKTAKRAVEFSFTDVLPGDPLAADLEELLMRSAKNKDKKSLWLIPGTLRPTEFGVDRGSTRINPGESVSIIETIRGLLVLSCLPPYTADEMQKKGFEGSLSSKVPRDMISNLPRDTSFPSRTLYRSQDHQREFDLSLFTYAQDLLRKDPRSPASPMTLDEASSLLSSALLRIAVAQKNLTPQAAEKKSADLRLAIARDLLGSSLDWRDESVLKRTPFTRAMFFQYLGTIVQNRTYLTPSVSVGVSLGEIWWQRVK